MKDKVRELWDICFADSKEFTDLYFSLRYKEDINIAIQENGKVISALQMIPYPMTFFDKIWNTSYISGACTLPDYRSKGIMRQLLNNSFKEMYNQGVDLCTLIPAESWLFDYYKKSGFETIFLYYPEPIITKQINTNHIRVQKEVLFSDEIYQYFDKKQRERECAILHTIDDFKVVLADLDMGNGGLYISKLQDEITSLAIVYERDTFIEINECMYNDEESLNILYNYIQQDLNHKNLIKYTIGRNDKNHPLGMARIINAAKVLRDYAAAFPQVKFNIELNDPCIDANNQCYSIDNGKCVLVDKPSTIVFTPIDITTLCARLIYPLHATMNLMLN